MVTSPSSTILHTLPSLRYNKLIVFDLKLF
jgi:hypothetical protein